MKWIVKNPGETAQDYTHEGGSSLEPLQKLVGGYITTVYHESLDEVGITAWANDEGLLIGQAPNLAVYGQPVVGPVVFTGHDDEGETVGLTDEQAETVGRFLKAVTLNEVQAAAVALRLGQLF